MSHLDDDQIAAAAIGERLVAGDAAHLVACAQCSRSVNELESLVARAGTVGPQEPLVAPPSHVWDAIVAEIAAEDAASSQPAALGEEPNVLNGGGLATVTPIRRSSIWRMAATAAVGVVIGGAGVGLWASRGGDDLAVVASASLTNLVTEDTAGTAQVERRPDGSQVLVVNTDYQTVTDRDLEVWLIDPNIEGMVSLGFLASSHGEFAIPEGYDPSAYPIVDISVEPRDGLPQHSGDSITRGILSF